MKKWNVPEVVELDVLQTMGGTQKGTEKNGKGDKWNGGTSDPGTGGTGGSTNV